LGAVVEWYDFFVFAAAAALVFDRAFFPKYDPLSGVLLSLMTYAVGFLTRPLGGVVFGVLGDRWGRKRALVASLFLMGLSTVGVGLIPTYDSIGVAAPVILVLLRLIQGLAVGGEVGGALLLVAESSPARHRGFFAAWPQMGGPAGNLLAALALATLTRVYGEQALLEGRWRIAFLASGLLIGVGVWMRARLEESPLYRELSKKPARANLSRLSLLRAQSRNILTVLLVKIGENALFYMFTTFFIVYLTRTVHVSRALALNATLVGSAVEVLVIFVAGAASDRFGRRPVTALGLVAATFVMFGMFPLLAQANAAIIVTAAVAGGACHGLIVGGMSAFFVELFPTAVRYTAFSLGYQVASVLSGAVAPLIGIALLERYGSTLPVSIYAASMALLALGALAAARETRGIRL
jgi:MFS family permease